MDTIIKNLIAIDILNYLQADEAFETNLPVILDLLGIKCCYCINSEECDCLCHQIDDFVCTCSHDGHCGCNIGKHPAIVEEHFYTNMVRDFHQNYDYIYHNFLNSCYNQKITLSETEVLNQYSSVIDDVIQKLKDNDLENRIQSEDR